MTFWKQLPVKEIKQRVFEALKKNVDYRQRSILGVPASHLDEHVFAIDAPFLNDAPFLSTLVHNPNHIGCHTLGDSEAFFRGTQKIEKEVIRLIAEDILQGEPEKQDGYVASGGTEANLQAIWIYRNYFLNEKGFAPGEIAILCSEDTHYSVYKASNLMQVDIALVRVEPENRQLDKADLKATILQLQERGVKGVVVVSNMMTTMFGTVDDIDLYEQELKHSSLEVMIHVDGAYGGFVYPFVMDDARYSFKNKSVTSFSLDAHKVLQAPFGTGVFVIRKGWMDRVENSKAEYVNGLDNTIIGSRSGANAVSVWMILQTYGAEAWKEKIHSLMHRTQWLCKELDDLKISYFRAPYSNIVAMDAKEIPSSIVQQFGLVPDRHDGDAQWVKAVIMEHVKMEFLEAFVASLSGSKVSME